MSAEEPLTRRAGRAFSSFMGGYPLPVLLISILISGMLMLLLALVVPVEGARAQAFIEEFRRWCFGYRDGQGVQWAYVTGMLTSPLLLCSVILLFWWEPLSELKGRPWRVMATAAPGIFFVGVLAMGFGYAGAQPETEFRFSPTRMRTHEDAPSFDLVDQDGQPLSMDQLRGRVVLITGVYSECGQTCPMILEQVRRVLRRLDPSVREDVSVVAITLAPERDTPARLREMGRRHALAEPNVHLVTGEPRNVERLLDALDFSRRDAERGVIDHVNLFIVVDRNGQIAYRFTLGETQEDWLVQALEFLARERPVG